jgi:hypothetical protein
MSERHLAFPDPLTIGLLPWNTSTRRVESACIFLIDMVVHHDRRSPQAATRIAGGGVAGIKAADRGFPITSRRLMNVVLGQIEPRINNSSASLCAGHDHVRVVAPATRTDQPLMPIGNGSLGAVSLRHFGGSGLN